MRLKLTLKRGGAAVRDIQVTADVTATIGDISRYLLGADPVRAVAAPIEDATLRVEFPGRGQARLLNPLLSVHESGLRSGCSIEVVGATSRRAGDDLYGRPVALVRVTAGPDAGAEFTIASGVNYVGTDAAAQVQLTDEHVSRRHASITVADSISISDLNSANGVEVDGALVSRAILTGRTRIRVGESELQLAQLGASRIRASTPSDVIVGATGIGEADPPPFSRSPRVEPAYRGASFPAPELPSVTETPRFPMLAVLSPIILGAVLFAVTQQVISLLFIALSPLIMLGTWIDNRIQAARKRRDEADRFIGSIAAMRESLTAERDKEVAARIAESPSTGEVEEAIRARSPLLWTRKPEHTTFLEVRFGTGRQASRNTIVAPSKNAASPEDWHAVTELVDEFSAVDPVPVIENLERAGAIGIAGSSSLAADAARAIVLQLVGLHSPADLALVAFAAGDSAAEWSWLKWLPHVDSAYSPLSVPALAGDFAAASLLLAQLEEIVSTRRAAGLGRGERVRSRLDEAKSLDAEHGAAVDRLPATPAIVAIVTAESPADRARLVALGNEGPDAGVFIVWLASTVASLPVVCRTYLDVIDATVSGLVGFVRSGQTVALRSIERLGPIAALDAAKSLASVEDTGAQVLDESDLPHTVSFLDLFDGPVADEPDAVTRRWAKNDSLVAAWSPGSHREPGGIRALVGQGPTEPFYLDVRRHGPHALVGGTTGSGKSEFLQTWIMGIATEYSPDRVSFLLVDYKGGAAFAECVTLPHTVGLVTDLNPHLVRRALTSLRAELKHRETLLNAKGAKDLEALEKRSDQDAPPALIIVIDEFAALAGEVPEFVDGVIDVAQRGRSLGLHLVMATQRPAGVIKESLRANTNLRVALRVADDADSLDVLGVPSAARFDPGTPGRAAAKLGPGRVLDFQTAYLGGWATGDHDAASAIEVSELQFGAGVDWVIPSRTGDLNHGIPRDIERLAGTIGRAATENRLAVPRKPWLDQLPKSLDLEAFAQESDERVVIGLVDEPEAQRQRPFEFALDTDGNLAVFGTGGSGKSTLLRTVAIAATRTAAHFPVAIYGLDFSGGALASLEDLPTVGSIIAGNDAERVARLVKNLASQAEERTVRYSKARASTLADYRVLTGDRTEPRIIVLVDGMAAFRSEYEFRTSGNLFDEFSKLVAMGRQVGIHFVISADRLGAFPSAMLATVQVKLVLRLAGDAEYAILGVPDDVLGDAPAGRGLAGEHELQVAVLGGSPELVAQAAATRKLAARLEAEGVQVAAEIERLPEHIHASTLPVAVSGRPTLGISDETLEPVGVPMTGMFVVSGPFGSGRTTAMTTIIRAIAATRPETRLYLIVARRSELASAIEWADSSRDADEAELLATRLSTMLEGPTAERDTQIVIVVENVGDFEGLPAESAVARLLKAARRADVPAIVEADTVTAASAWQIFTELKTARAGIVLQPEETDGVSLFRVQFPRVTRADFPVGRGIFVAAGRLSRVQVAVSAPAGSPIESATRGRRATK